jgi:hypothetical protein
LKALWVFFFPWTREVGKEEDFFFPCFSPTSLPLITQKDIDQGPSTCTAFHVLELGRRGVPRVVEGRLNSGRPVHPTPLRHWLGRGVGLLFPL